MDDVLDRGDYGVGRRGVSGCRRSRYGVSAATMLRLGEKAFGSPRVTLPAVLDWAHKLALRAVDEGDAGDSPAMRRLVATGLVEQQSDDRYALTAAGRVALEDDKPERWQRILWPIVASLSVVFIIITVIDWVR
jgi:hypothetical protein